MAGNPKLDCASLAVGSAHEQVLVENLTRTQIVQYAGASGDFNPIHHDEMFASKAAGYPSVFAHGMLTMGLTGRLLTDWLGDGVLREFGVRFVKQVWPGDTLTATRRREGDPRRAAPRAWSRSRSRRATRRASRW